MAEIDYIATRDWIRKGSTTEQRSQWAAEKGFPPRLQLWTKGQVEQFCKEVGIAIAFAGGGTSAPTGTVATPQQWAEVVGSKTDAPTTAVKPTEVAVEPRWKRDTTLTPAPCGKTSTLKKSLVTVAGNMPIDTAFHCGNRSCTICNKNAQSRLTVDRDFPQGMSRNFTTGSFNDGSTGVAGQDRMRRTNPLTPQPDESESVLKAGERLESAEDEDDATEATATDAAAALEAAIEAMRQAASKALADSTAKDGPEDDGPWGSGEDFGDETEDSDDDWQDEDDAGAADPNSVAGRLKAAKGKAGKEPTSAAGFGPSLLVSADGSADGAPSDQGEGEDGDGDGSESDQDGNEQGADDELSPDDEQDADDEQGDEPQDKQPKPESEQEPEPETPLHDLIRTLARDEDAKGDYATRDEVVEGLTEATKGLVTERTVREIIKATPAGLDEERVTAIANVVAADVAAQMDRVVLGETLKQIDERAKAIALKVLASQIKRTIEIKRENMAPIVIDGLAHPVFERALARYAMGFNNIFLVGPAGSGKTTLAKQIAQALGRDFGFLGLTSGISEAHIGGRFLPVGDMGRYLLSRFVQIYEGGGVFLLDELDGADSNVLLSVNEAMANNVMPVPNRFDNPIAHRHPDTVIIGAANTYGHGADRVYVGRNQLDAATLDRFVGATFEMDYDRSLEGKLVSESLGGTAAARLCEQYWDIRDRVYAAKMRRVWGTRGLLASAKMVKGGMAQQEALGECMTGWLKDERQKVGMAA